MTRHQGSTESMAEHMRASIDQVGDDCWKIEVWTGALMRLASPVPVYEAGNWLKFLAPAPVPAE
jgi:hypothetical protein